MESLTRVLTILTLSVTALHTVYSLTVAGLWSYVLERAFWWAAFGSGLFAFLAVGSWALVRFTAPALSGDRPVAVSAHPAVAGRIGTRASSLSDKESSSRAA